MTWKIVLALLNLHACTGLQVASKGKVLSCTKHRSHSSLRLMCRALSALVPVHASLCICFCAPCDFNVTQNFLRTKCAAMRPAGAVCIGCAQASLPWHCADHSEMSQVNMHSYNEQAYIDSRPIETSCREICLQRCYVCSKAIERTYPWGTSNAAATQQSPVAYPFVNTTSARSPALCRVGHEQNVLGCTQKLACLGHGI